MTVLLVALGAAVGAPLRYLVDRAVQARLGSALPWGTLTVNIVGSLVLGALVGGAVPGSLLALLGTGLCGALTTYSTFGYETVRLFEEGAHHRALIYAGLSVGAAIGAAVVGVTVAEALWS